MFTVYILYSVSLKKYYVGQTNNYERRINDHNSRQSKYTSKGIPWILIYKEEKSDRTESIKLEITIKKKRNIKIS